MNIEVWKKRKTELKLTHDALAATSGISRRTIAGIFSGDPKYASPTLNTVNAIEKALGISDGQNGGEEYYLKTCFTEGEKEALSLYREIGLRCGEEKQAFYLEMGKAILHTKNK